MNKEEIFSYLSKNGYTKAAVKHSEFPKEIVLEHLELRTDVTEQFKIYYQEFINELFQ